METIDNIIKCNLCSNILAEPIILPCGTTICKKHVDELLSNNEVEIYCYSCNAKHHISKNVTYPPNKVADALIKKRFDKLDFADFGEEYNNAQKALLSLKLAYENYEKKRTHPDTFVTEFFNNLIREIDVKRDELKEKIDKLSDTLIEDLRIYKKRFEEEALSSSITGENFQNIKAYIERSENNLNSFVINQDLWKSIFARSQSFEKLLNKQMLVFEDILLYKKSKELNEKFLNLYDVFHKGLDFNQ